MNIIQFLIDNYIWIIAIVLITIVTIIGFLADKKKSGNKKEQTATPDLENKTMFEQLQYQDSIQMTQNPMNNNMVMPQNNLNNINQVNFGQPMMQGPQTIQPMQNPIEPMNNNPQPIENIAGNMVQEPMHQPLSEQQPLNILPAQTIPNYNNQQNNVMPMPNVDINQNQEPMPVENNFNNMPQMIMPQPVQPMPTYNNPTPMVNDVNSNVPNFIANAGTIPQPVNEPNQQVVPQPVVPQMIMPQPMIQEQASIPTYNNYQQPASMQQNIQLQPTQPNAAPNTSGQPMQNTTSPTPTISFVYGPQNNNQNM